MPSLMRWSALLGILGALACPLEAAGPPALAPTFAHEAQVFASDGEPEDGLGSSVSVHGDTAVVGAQLEDPSGSLNAGAAYVFVRAGGGWIQQQKLTALDGMPDDHFGHAVAVYGDTVVIGAFLHNTVAGPDAGAAYVFVRSGTNWALQQILSAVPGAPSAWFGYSVSISGDTIVVGAAQEMTLAGTASGAAYVFVRSGTTWTQQQRLVASDGATGAGFGWSVSASTDTAVAGAIGDDPNGLGSGSAYVFVRVGTTWTQQQKLVASDGAVNSQFGYAVSVSSDGAVIGAPNADTPAGIRSGAAYVFARSGSNWSEQQKLVPADLAADDALGFSVSLDAETAVLGAFGHDTGAGPDAGMAYVFARSGTTWTEGQSLTPPDASGFDYLGFAVFVSGDTVLVAAPGDTTAGGFAAGSAHFFRAQADLAVTKTDGQSTAVPGHPLTYTIVVSNSGPSAAPGVAVTDVPPPSLLAVTWTCVASPGSSCTAGGVGGINDSASLAADGTLTYMLTGMVAPGATGTLTNVAVVAAPTSVSDPNPTNNSATDVDTLAPETDLGVTKTDSADPVSPGDPLTYTVTVTNHGPSDSAGVTVVDLLPPVVTFVSSVPGPPTCTLSGATLTCVLGALSAGSSATVTINVTVDAGAGGILVNTAVVSGADPDPNPGNNSASAATGVGLRDGELAHGSVLRADLAAQPGPVADDDIFRISQKPHSSYEIVVDGTSGDIGAGAGPSLQRMAPNGTTVIQESAAIGVGPSRSLRWRNTSSTTVEGETVRVRSTQCGTDCGPDDVYRIRVYETTYSVPRFNNSGTQITVLILQNPTDDPITGEIYFSVPSGAQVAVQPFSLTPRTTLVLNTATVPGANGVSGAITVSHDGRYGDLMGKTVALEPSTGFSFDSALEPRRR